MIRKLIISQLIVWALRLMKSGENGRLELAHASIVFHGGTIEKTNLLRSIIERPELKVSVRINSNED